MKHFKIVGPETTREFDIEDHQLVEWGVRPILPGDLTPCEEQNVRIYPTVES